MYSIYSLRVILKMYSFLFVLKERNIYSECFVILLQIAIENNTYLGTWRIFTWELGVKQEGVAAF